MKIDEADHYPGSYAMSEIWYPDGDQLRFVLRKHTVDGSPQRTLQMLWFTAGMEKREWRDVPTVDETEI